MRIIWLGDIIIIIKRCFLVLPLLLFFYLLVLVVVLFCSVLSLISPFLTAITSFIYRFIYLYWNRTYLYPHHTYTMAASEIVVPSHPYYPINIKLVGYIPNEYGVLELVSMFGAGCAVILAATLCVVQFTAPKIRGADKLAVLWFVLSMFLFSQSSFLAFVRMGSPKLRGHANANLEQPPASISGLKDTSPTITPACLLWRICSDSCGRSIRMLIRDTLLLIHSFCAWRLSPPCVWPFSYPKSPLQSIICECIANPRFSNDCRLSGDPSLTSSSTSSSKNPPTATRSRWSFPEARYTVISCTTLQAGSTSISSDWIIVDRRRIITGSITSLWISSGWLFLDVSDHLLLDCTELNWIRKCWLWI